MSIVLFDNPHRNNLFPLTCTCAVADLRIGILTICERWELKTQQEVFVSTESYLQSLYNPIPAGQHTLIDASILSDDPNGKLDHPWEIVIKWNKILLEKDFELLTKGRVSQPIPLHVHATNPESIFIEEGAVVEHAFLNASEGPIYIGKNVLIMDGAMIRGAFAACEGAVIKAGAKIYGATTIGPYCTVGGEVKNVIMMGYSNKAHDGYLGDAVIGKWCNLGAGTSNSNVKNTGGNVTVWDAHSAQLIDVGLKCGVIMGDYSRTAINSAINTGSIIGVCCNVFEHGLTKIYIPDFSWGNERYQWEKALQDIANWKKMKGKTLSENEIKVLQHIFAQSAN